MTRVNGKQIVQPLIKIPAIVLRRGLLPFIGWMGVGVFTSLIGFFSTFDANIGACMGEGNCILGILLAVFWILASPVAYFVLARRFAIMRTLFYLLRYFQEPLWVFILKKYFAAAKAQKGKVTENTLIKYAKAYKKRLYNMSWLMRNIVRVLLFIVPFFEVMEETLEKEELDALTPEELADEMAPRLSHATADLLSGYMSLPLWGLFGLQWMVMLVIWTL